MSFLAPYLLLALPLAALPVVIHLIHLRRRRTIEWAAMMFLFAAQQMNRGYTRLRQYLILAARVAAVLGIIFVIARPLAGGWLGLTGGAPDTVLVLLDRSASMEQQNLATGQSKRTAALAKMAQGITDLFGSRSKVVLIDSATLRPTEIANAAALTDLTTTAATDTTADLPSLMQAGLDYITTHKLGRTDVWIASDLRQNDWAPAQSRWETLRSAFSQLQGVRFHVLAYPDAAAENLSISVENISRRAITDKPELLMDLRIRRQSANPTPQDVPVAIVLNGVRSTLNVVVKDGEALVQGHTVPIDKAMSKGTGYVELPADANARDNIFYFTFDQPAVPLSYVISDDPDVITPARAVLSSPTELGRKQEVRILPSSRANEIDWDQAALILWQAPLPASKDISAQQLINHIEAGRSVMFLPPQRPTSESFLGLSWAEWKNLPETQANTPVVEWWRSSDGLLANTRSGQTLSVNELKVQRACSLTGDGATLARLHVGQPLLTQALHSSSGLACFLTTLPSSSCSSLARDGVVWYIMLQRALAESSKSLGNAQQRQATQLLHKTYASWKRNDEVVSSLHTLQAGTLSSADKSLAINRPLNEDLGTVLNSDTLSQLFSGLSFHRVDDNVDDKTQLANEIWRSFLLLMAAALILEAILCLPKRKAALAAA